MNAETLTGLILLSQPMHCGISLKDMRDALPEAYRDLPYLATDVDVSDLAQQAIQSKDWAAVRRAVDEQFQNHVEPLRTKYPDYRIAYFGSAPIPLAIYLGFLVEAWRQVEVFQYHHQRRSWRSLQEEGRQQPKLLPLKWPNERDRSPGEAIIRVSTSHPVDPLVTRRVVPEPIVEIDISLEEPAEDAFASHAEIEPVSEAFKRALDEISDKFTGVRVVHVFASVQPGVAFLLGTRVSRTMHPPIQAYQYARNEDQPHSRALLINGPTPFVAPLLNEEESERAQQDRVKLAEDIELLKGLALRAKPRGGEGWAQALLQQDMEVLGGVWRHLPPLCATPLPRTSVDIATQTVEDRFQLSPQAEQWQLADHLLLYLARRLSDEDSRLRALRMLLLHESVHRGPQRLTRTSSQGIGRFPKVLEEMDYQADVWTMLHEYSLTRFVSPSITEKPRRFFMGLIRVATETMWAFDDGGPPLREIQIRRLNRYLIWYWQYLVLEHGNNSGEEMTLAQVMAVLAQRPFIELAGPEVVAHDKRVFFRLGRDSDPELAIYQDGKLYRHGHRVGFSIPELLDGVHHRSGEQIREVLRGAFEQTVR